VTIPGQKQQEQVPVPRCPVSDLSELTCNLKPGAYTPTVSTQRPRRPLQGPTCLVQHDVADAQGARHVLPKKRNVLQTPQCRKSKRLAPEAKFAMSDPQAQQRAAIRSLCQSIRRLLNYVRPACAVFTEQEVGAIECSALAASNDQLPAVMENLQCLIRKLQETDYTNGAKLLNQERWERFFGGR